MKQPINEIKKMQRLAGLITESEYQESMINESNDFGNFEGTLEDFGIYDESTNTFEVEIGSDAYNDYMDSNFPEYDSDESIEDEGYNKWLEDIKKVAITKYGPETKVELI